MSRALQIHVGEGIDAMTARAADAWRRAERGEVVREDHLTFETWETLARTLSGGRLELLSHLHRHPAASVAELARRLNRDEARVREDVAALATIGLLDEDAAGALSTEYDELKAVITL